MADAFDPYHKWLSIPPREQPPNHYRLLGLDLFESDAEVIDLAANRQMAFVKSCASGPHFALTQKLLNEIAAARLCLLSPDRKLKYDDELRKRQPVTRVVRRDATPRSTSARASPAKAPVPQAALAGLPPSGGLAAAIVPPTSKGPRTSSLASSRRTSPWPAVLALSLFAMVVGAVVVLVSLTGGGTTPPQNNGGGSGENAGGGGASGKSGGKNNRQPGVVRQPDWRKQMEKAAPPDSVVLDNIDSSPVGNWTSVTDKSAGKFSGFDYLVDDGTGSGQFFARFDMPAGAPQGKYEVRLSYVAGDDRATNVPVLIDTGSGSRQQLSVNQREAPLIDGQFKAIGEFHFLKGAGSVTIHTQGADGTVVVDSVVFVPVDRPPPEGGASSKTP